MQRWDLRSLDVQAHHPQVLHSEGEGRTIALHLPAGDALQEHQVHERAWLVVIDGEIEVDGAGGADTSTAGPGHVFVFDPGERHEVRARSDARLLLMLAPWPGQGHPRQASSAS
jgi:redox-sensitive bicupin YhaK (pirin superfamily)